MHTFILAFFFCVVVAFFIPWCFFSRLCSKGFRYLPHFLVNFWLRFIFCARWNTVATTSLSVVRTRFLTIHNAPEWVEHTLQRYGFSAHTYVSCKSKWDDIKRKLRINNLKMSLSFAFSRQLFQFPWKAFLSFPLFHSLFEKNVAILCTVVFAHIFILLFHVAVVTVKQIAIMRVWCCHNWHRMLCHCHILNTHIHTHKLLSTLEIQLKR